MYRMADRGNCTVHSSPFLSFVLFFLPHMRVPDFARISGDPPATKREHFNPTNFPQRNKSNRTNWTRKCSYIFPYLRLRNRFRITPNKLGHAVFPVLFTCLPGFPSPRLNKPVPPFFRSVNTTTWIVGCETPLRGRQAHPAPQFRTFDAFPALPAPP